MAQVQRSDVSPCPEVSIKDKNHTLGRGENLFFILSKKYDLNFSLNLRKQLPMRVMCSVCYFSSGFYETTQIAEQPTVGVSITQS